MSLINLPSSVKKTEKKGFDEYIGKAEDLIAAGLVKPEQFPPDGRSSVSYLSGVVMPRRCRMDETYLHVAWRDDLEAPWAVRIGLPRGELLKRRAEAREKNRVDRAESLARWAAEKAAEDIKDRTEQAERAKQKLVLLPKSEREFIQLTVSQLRAVLHNVYLKRIDEEHSWHGYRFSTETKEAALMAIDAIVEALVQGEVIFNADLQARVVAEHQAAIRAADPSFEKQFKALTSPNPAILEGEAS